MRIRGAVPILLALTAIGAPAATSDVVAAGMLGPIRPPGAVVTAPAVRVHAPDPPPPATHFATLSPGSALPDDATCAAAVRPAAERRPQNAVANHTTGIGSTAGYLRVTGNFTGSTDEIVQWVACKWGIDEDIVRAQIAKESWWYQSATGDLTSDQALCHPLFRTTDGSNCPESIGLGQVRYQYHGVAFANDNAIRSSAANLDYTYAIWRSCYEGELTWLNTVERGATYAAGDVWGCVGVWFSGRWHVPAAEGYIAAVQEYLTQRVWETPGFQAG